MTDYTKLVEALRYCSRSEVIACRQCEYYGKEWPIGCEEALMADAADAIEALQAEQKKTVTQIFCEEQQKWEEYCTGLMSRICELKAQMPKRGKWVGVSPMVDTVQCSVCGGQLFSAELETPYCPYCGAKMEVQDADS